jgi:hypothetical protein
VSKKIKKGLIMCLKKVCTALVVSLFSLVGVGCTAHAAPPETAKNVDLNR